MNICCGANSFCMHPFTVVGGQGQNKNMASRIRQLDEQVIRQQELLYNVEFQLQQVRSPDTNYATVL